MSRRNTVKLTALEPDSADRFGRLMLRSVLRIAARRLEGAGYEVWRPDDTPPAASEPWCTPDSLLDRGSGDVEIMLALAPEPLPNGDARSAACLAKCAGLLVALGYPRTHVVFVSVFELGWWDNEIASWLTFSGHASAARRGVRRVTQRPLRHSFLTPTDLDPTRAGPGMGRMSVLPMAATSAVLDPTGLRTLATWILNRRGEVDKTNEYDVQYAVVFGTTVDAALALGTQVRRLGYAVLCEEWPTTRVEGWFCSGVGMDMVVVGPNVHLELPERGALRDAIAVGREPEYCRVALSGARVSNGWAEKTYRDLTDSSVFTWFQLLEARVDDWAVQSTERLGIGEYDFVQDELDRVSRALGDHTSGNVPDLGGSARRRVALMRLAQNWETYRLLRGQRDLASRAASAVTSSLCYEWDLFRADGFPDILEERWKNYSREMRKMFLSLQEGESASEGLTYLVSFYRDLLERLRRGTPLERLASKIESEARKAEIERRLRVKGSRARSLQLWVRSWFATAPLVAGWWLGAVMLFATVYFFTACGTHRYMPLYDQVLSAFGMAIGTGVGQGLVSEWGLVFCGPWPSMWAAVHSVISLFFIALMVDRWIKARSGV